MKSCNCFNDAFRRLLTLLCTMTLLLMTSEVESMTKEQMMSRPVNDLLLEQHNIFRQDEKASNIFKMVSNGPSERKTLCFKT